MSTLGVDLEEYRTSQLSKNVLQLIDINKTPISHLHFIIYALQNQLALPSTSSIVKSKTKNQAKTKVDPSQVNTGRRRRFNTRNPNKVSKYIQSPKYGTIYQCNLNLKSLAYQNARGRRRGNGTQILQYMNFMNLNPPVLGQIGSIPQFNAALVPPPPMNLNPPVLGQIGSIPQFNAALVPQSPIEAQLPKRQILIIVPQTAIREYLSKLYPEKKTKNSSKSMPVPDKTKKAFAIKSFQNIILKAERNTLKTKLQTLIQEKKAIKTQPIEEECKEQADKFNTKDIMKVLENYNHEVPVYFQKKKRSQKRRRIQKHQLIKNNKEALFSIYGNAIFSKCWPVSRQEIKMALGLIKKDNISQNVELAQNLYCQQHNQAQQILHPENYMQVQAQICLNNMKIQAQNGDISQQ